MKRGAPSRIVPEAVTPHSQSPATLDGRSLLAIAGLTAVVLTGHLAYLGLAEQCSPTLVGCPVGNAIWAQPDTTGYVRVARDIAEVYPAFAAEVWGRDAAA